MHTKPHVLLVGAACALFPVSAFAQISGIDYVGQIDLPGGGEIVSYTPDAFTLATTYSTGATQGVNLYNFSGASSSYRATVDFADASIFGAASNIYSVSSVALDPLGRGFGVATIIPTANTTTVGKLAFFNYNTGSLLHSIEVGYHPDSVRFSPDGLRLVVANEGEANIGTSAADDGSDAPGSVSVVSLAGISLANLTSVTPATTRDFSAGNLAGTASLAGVRNPYITAMGNPGNTAGQQALNTGVPDFGQVANQQIAGIEPEYVVVHGDKAYASLQENNAIAVLDLNTNQYTAIHRLGTITQTIDASDTGAVADIDQTVKGLPMPDTIAVVTIGGTGYIVTANEGDARIDDRDLSRYGSSAATPLLDAAANVPALRANAELGRLNISRIDGDTDADGDIDEITMFGTRSFSIWDASTGVFVADSGSLEAQLLALDPTRHNINREGTAIDNRSDDKGPEPEGLTTFTFDGKTYVAIGLERQNGVMIYDISNPLSPGFVDYVNGVDNALISPESLIFISSADSPDGLAYILSGYEGVDGTGANAGIGIYGVASIPEPSACAALAGVGVLGLAACRRRRVAR